MKELSFKLSKPIQVSKDGGFEEVFELVLTAPSMKDRKQAAKLTQFIARAEDAQSQKFIKSIGLKEMQAMADEAQKAGKTEFEVGDKDVKSNVRELILASNDELEDFFASFETLMLRVCTVLDGTHIMASHIELLELSDFEDLCFEYCENFIK